MKHKLRVIFFSNLAQNVIEKLPTGLNKFDINSVREFYKLLNIEENPFHMLPNSLKRSYMTSLEFIGPPKILGPSLIPKLQVPP